MFLSSLSLLNFFKASTIIIFEDRNNDCVAVNFTWIHFTVVCDVICLSADA
jgi:hypothetical protein